MPVGRWVMRTAESVVLTCWPPAPDERIVSMRMSSLRISMSMSSASGSTATVAADVWMRPCVSVSRHALHPVHAGFEFQLRKHAAPGDGRNDFLVAAGIALACRKHFDLPALARRVALVHPEEIAGKQRRLRTAGAGADFKDGALFVGRVLRQKQDLHLLLERLDALLDLRLFHLGKVAHLAIGIPGRSAAR